MVKKDNILIKKKVGGVSRAGRGLIKTSALLKEIHKNNMRANKRTIEHLTNLLQENILGIIEILTKELIVKGKKTLTIQDIDAVFEKLKEKEEVPEAPEV